jgi:UDP-glucose 4-epimerase
MEQMKILVTGGAGFVASHVVDAYLDEGHQVLVVDNLSTGQREHVHPEARLLEMDLNDFGLFDLLETERPEVVNHHAANASVAVSFREPVFDARQNVLARSTCWRQRAGRARASSSTFLLAGPCMATRNTCRWTRTTRRTPSHPTR